MNLEIPFIQSCTCKRMEELDNWNMHCVT